MQDRFAYSFDRDTFTGSFDTPDQALAVAIEQAKSAFGSPTTVYIGRITEADPQAASHAITILKEMARRARQTYGPDAQQYLQTATKQQVRELDAILERTILEWQQRHRLTPGFTRITQVAEFPVPTPRGVALGNGEDGEVSEIGTQDYTVEVRPANPPR